MDLAVAEPESAVRVATWLLGVLLGFGFGAAAMATMQYRTCQRRFFKWWARELVSARKLLAYALAADGLPIERAREVAERVWPSVEQVPNETKEKHG